MTQVNRPEMPVEITLSLQTVANWMWGQMLETHLKPSWKKRAEEVERHHIEKARLMQIIDGLQEALRLHDVVRTPEDMMQVGMGQHSFKFDQETIEALLAPLLKAKNEKGLHIYVPPKHIFTPWVLSQLPKE